MIQINHVNKRFEELEAIKNVTFSGPKRINLWITWIKWCRKNNTYEDDCRYL